MPRRSRNGRTRHRPKRRPLTLRARGWTVLRIWGHELKRAHTRRVLTRLHRSELEARLALQG
jgi:very-short-patch-repair endonuclease